MKVYCSFCEEFIEERPDCDLVTDSKGGMCPKCFDEQMGYTKLRFKCAECDFVGNTHEIFRHFIKTNHEGSEQYFEEVNENEI